MNLNIAENSSKMEIVKNLIKKNLKAIIVLSSIILFTFFCYLYLKEAKIKKEIKISNEFNDARILIQKKETNKAKEKFYKIIDDQNSFYSPLSLYLVIENNMESDEKIISSLFDKVINIGDIDNETKNLVKIKKTLFLMKANKNEQEILNELKPIINSESIWRQNAIEIIGGYFLSKGDKIKSEEFYNLLDKSKNK